MATPDHQSSSTELPDGHPQTELPTQGPLGDASGAGVSDEGGLEAGASTSSRPSSSKQAPLNASHLRERKRRGRYALKKLEKKLEILDRQIRKYNEAEVTLEEMNSGTSSYMKEDLLKRKFVKTWQQLCKLQGIPDEIVIEDPDSGSYTQTPYPEINRRVVRVLRLDEFPDYFDMCQLVERCNAKHKLGITSEEKTQLSKKIFKDVGRILKKRRQRDFKELFGSHLTDRVRVEEDPALQSEDLLRELKESIKKGQQALEEVCESFVIQQDSKYKDGEKSPSGDSCTENDEEEEEAREGGMEEEGAEEAMALDLHLESPLSDSNSSSPDSTLGAGPFAALSDEHDGVVDSTLPSDNGEATVTTTAPSPSLLPPLEEDEEEEDDEQPAGLRYVRHGTEPDTSQTRVTSSSSVVVLDDSSEEDVVVID